MMKILLLNKNPVISKLVRLSAEKLDYEFEEEHSYNKKMTEYYEIIIIDNEIKADLKNLENRCKKLICLSSKDSNIQDDIQILHKPFLPTDLITLIKDEQPPVSQEETGEQESLTEIAPEDTADFSADSLELESQTQEPADEPKAQEEKPKVQEQPKGEKEGFEESDLDKAFKMDEIANEPKAEEKLEVQKPNKKFLQDVVKATDENDLSKQENIADELSLDSLDLPDEEPQVEENTAQTATQEPTVQNE